VREVKRLYLEIEKIKQDTGALEQFAYLLPLSLFDLLLGQPVLLLKLHLLSLSAFPPCCFSFLASLRFKFSCCSSSL